MQELTKKIEQILKAKFPEYTAEEINQVLQDCGKVAIFETLDKVLKMLPDEESKYVLGELMGEDKTEEAVVYAQTKGVDMTEIFEEVSKSIVVDLFG